MVKVFEPYFTPERQLSGIVQPTFYVFYEKGRYTGQMQNETKSQLFIIGALHLDETASAAEPLIMGESNPVRWTRSVGGVAANVARAAVGADAKITMLANYGNSATGHSLRATLLKAGVHVLPMNQNRKGLSTGRYCTVVQPDGELLIGLADVSQAEEISSATILQHLNKRHFDTVLFDGNLSATTMAEFTSKLRSKSLSIHSANPPINLMAASVSPSKAHRFVKSLAFLDVLFCNRQEAIALTTNIEPTVDVSTEIILSTLCSYGCSHIVMTDGAAGVHVQSNNERTHIRVEPVQSLLNFNGPGDALVGATAAELPADNITHQTLADAVLNKGIPAAQAVLTGDATPPNINDVND